MNKLEIILEKRRNRRKRSRVPINNFITKWLNASDLLEKIHKKIRARELIQEARRQYIISLVTGLEVFLKDAFVQLIDKYNFDYEPLVKKKSYPISLIDMQYIIKHKVTMGEMIAEQFNFQNLDSIQDAFSSLLGFDFFSALKKYKWIFDDKKPDGYLQLAIDFYIKIDRLIKLRHSFAHDVNFKKKLTMNEITKLDIELLTFANLLDFFIEDLIDGKINLPHSRF